MNNRKFSSFMLFAKSALVTAFLLALLMLTVLGVLAADKGTKAADGKIGGFELYAPNDGEISFELFGAKYSVDTRPIVNAADNIARCYNVLSPETRLVISLYEPQSELLDKFFGQF